MVLKLIHNRIRKCANQRKLDILLTLVSFGGVVCLIHYAYGTHFGLIFPFLFLNVLVHATVMFYCYRLWTLRIQKWKAMERGLALMQNVQEIFTETSGLQSSLSVSADIGEGILQSQPI